MSKNLYDVIIIGGGAAGLSAAIYAVRYNFSTLVISKDFGGQILETDKIENYPGFKSILGFDLSRKFKEHAESLGAELKVGTVKNIITKKGAPPKDVFRIETDMEKYSSRALIISVGAKHRKLHIPGEEEFAGKGVSYCPTCDAAFFRDKTVAVVGGGDAGVTGAIHIASIAKKTYLIHRREEFRAKPSYVDQAANNKRIEFVLNTNVIEAKGSRFLESIVLDKTFKGKRELKVDGLFIEIGLIPETELAKRAGIQLDKRGYIKVNSSQSTNIKGIFAAGDATNGSDRFAQLTTAVSEGSIAARGVYRYIRNEAL